MRVLVAVGEPNLRLAVELLLSGEPDINVVGSASDPGAMQALIATTQFDLVISEWQILERPGRPLRHMLDDVRSRDKKTKVIAIGADDDATQPPAGGVDALVPKGSPPEAVLEAIRRLASSSESNQSER